MFSGVRRTKKSKTPKLKRALQFRCLTLYLKLLGSDQTSELRLFRGLDAKLRDRLRRTNALGRALGSIPIGPATKYF
jgi:hypothetical protein